MLNISSIFYSNFTIKRHSTSLHHSCYSRSFVAVMVDVKQEKRHYQKSEANHANASLKRLQKSMMSLLKPPWLSNSIKNERSSRHHPRRSITLFWTSLHSPVWPHVFHLPVWRQWSLCFPNEWSELAVIAIRCRVAPRDQPLVEYRSHCLANERSWSYLILELF